MVHLLCANYLGDTYEALISAGRAEYSVVEIPVSMVERKYGKSSASAVQVFRFTIKAIGVWALNLHQVIRTNPRSLET